jgi:hypothetical protein
MAQAIQSSFSELNVITNVTVGYSYAVLVQPLDTNTFGRIMDATGAAVITIYLNIPGRSGLVSTTWRNASDVAINPTYTFAVNQWLLVLRTVQDGLGVMYVNGVAAASNTTVNLSNSWAGQTGQLVYNSTGNGSSMANANFSSWWVWNNRVLTAAEAAQMYANPWAMFHSGAQQGFIKGTKILLTNLAAVQNVWFYSHAAGGNIRLGLYDNSSPKNLLWQSGIISNTATNAWITVPIATGTPGTLALFPGTYWLAWQVDSTYDAPSYTAGASGDGFFCQPKLWRLSRYACRRAKYGGNLERVSGLRAANPAVVHRSGLATGRNTATPTQWEHQCAVWPPGLHQSDRLASTECHRLCEQWAVAFPGHERERFSEAVLPRRLAVSQPFWRWI